MTSSDIQRGRLWETNVSVPSLATYNSLREKEVWLTLYSVCEVGEALEKIRNGVEEHIQSLKANPKLQLWNGYTNLTML